MRRNPGKDLRPEIICLVLTTVLFTNSMLEAKTNVPGTVLPEQAGAATKPTLKERLIAVPPGTMIEVKLLNKQKIRGRLGEITDEGFRLTTAQGDKIGTPVIAFTDVKSFKKVEGGKGGHALLYALAGVGVVFVVLAIIVATRED